MMTEETIQPSEEELLAFISSRQDEEMSRPRALAIQTIDKYPGLRVWAFEDAPASSETPRDQYIRNARKAHFVVWLIGSTTTPPVVEEVSACMQAGGKLLAFKLPASVRDTQTEDLIGRVSNYATWRTVESIERLPDHIRAALTDEIVRGFNDPAPANPEQFLRQRKRESIADTKRLWGTLGVPGDLAEELAEDQSIGDKLDAPTSGVLKVTADQGSGKTLAAHRLYQRAVDRRIQDYFQPFPLLLNARTLGGDLKNRIEDEIGDQGPVYNQPVLVIIDGLDEVGRYRGNQILDQSTSFTDANHNVSAVVMTRPVPGLRDAGESTALPGCGDDEFLAITSKIAGRPVDYYEIPHRISKTRIPLFAVIVGTHLRNTKNPPGATPSQMVTLLVQRILEESLDYQEETAELLKKLAVASIRSGEFVPKSTVDPKAALQGRLADSRIVIEANEKLDFSIAIFREWFAAMAIVEGAVRPADLDLTSDRWVVPLAIAVNAGPPSLSRDIMETISTNDPGMASLVLKEVKHNWSTEEPSETIPPGTAVEIGHSIREAMANWGEGLGPLMRAIGPTSRGRTIPSLLVGKGPRLVTTSWYQGNPS